MSRARDAAHAAHRAPRPPAFAQLRAPAAAERDDRTDELHRVAKVAAHNRVNTVIAAAKPEQRSWELRDEDQGLFTHELLQGLRGRADIDASGAVTIGELARFVESRVREESVRRGYLPQEPVWRTHHADRADILPLAAFGDAARSR